MVFLFLVQAAEADSAGRGALDGGTMADDDRWRRYDMIWSVGMYGK